MGGDDTSVLAPAPAVTLERKSGSQIALALTVFALVLASNSIINESWLTNTLDGEDSDTQAENETSANIDIALREFAVESCVGEECETHVEEYKSLYSNCTDMMKEADANKSATEEACGDFADFYNAGFVATIMLVIAGVLLFIATIMHVRSMTGSNSRMPNFVSGGAGIWTGLAILSWYYLLPETDTDPEWGQGLWMALIAASSGVLAGFSGKFQSWIDGPPRMRAHGVRSGTEMNEFVLKESSCGDHTLSILVDSDLIRVARISRIGASPSIKDVLATRRDSYTGFSHQRLDWLDDFKGIWWVLTGATLISSFMISSLFLIPLTLAALLALLQLMDPERFVVSTNSGDHPFYINRWRSNRELTDLAMDLVDDAMIAVLRGEDLDTEKLDARADLIAERFSANREAQQAAEAAAAEKQASIQAANPQPAPPVSVAAPPSGPPVSAEVSAPPTPVPTTGPPDVEWPAPEPPADVAESEPEPEVEEEPAGPSPPVEQPPQPPPTQGPPVTTPPVTIPPPPPLPAAMPAPPPMPAAIPPPPAMGGMPAPPPPAGAAILPPIANPQPTAPPPPVLVQASPREENLTDDEKDNLLGDLSS